MTVPALGYMSNAGRTNAEMKQALEDITAWARAAVGGAAASALTIASGSITPTGAIGVVDTEGAAATDDLANIAQTNIGDGGLLLLVLSNAARNVVIKHMAGGTGQIFLSRAVDLELDVTDQAILLRRNGTRWDQVFYNPGTLAKRPQSKSSGYTVVGTDYDSPIRCSAALTLSLTAAATLGAGFFFWVYANGGNVTIDPSGAELINGATTLVIANGCSALIYNDGGTAWRAMVSTELNALVAETSVATTDTLHIFDTSEGVENKATLANVFLALVATQAEMEAASVTTSAVTPGRVRNHPGVAKCWAKFDMTGSMSVNHNVSGVADTSAALKTVTVGTNDFSSADYVVTATAVNTDASFASNIQVSGTTAPTSGVFVIYHNTEGGGISDIMVVAFGDQ